MLQREWAAHYRSWKRKKHLFQMEKGGEALSGWLRTWQTICSSAITELLRIIWAMKKKPGKMYAQILGAGTWKIGKITTQDNEGLEIVKLVVYFAISLFKGDNPYYHLAYIYRRGRKLKLMSQEEDISQWVLKVKWEWFEYIPISNEGEEERRLTLVTKTSKTGEMFPYFKTLFESFPVPFSSKMATRKNKDKCW